jgi:hypothetical protein
MEPLDTLAARVVLSGDLDPCRSEFCGGAATALGGRVEEVDVDVAGGGDEEVVLDACTARCAGAAVMVPLLDGGVTGLGTSAADDDLALTLQALNRVGRATLAQIGPGLLEVRVAGCGNSRIG